ncbi:MAG: hypothetical protein H6668_13190 [Ardenticatenaceae bacterium]|nr:hypothetical protein [Ardenticatenaceae bacterium]
MSPRRLAHALPAHAIWGNTRARRPGDKAYGVASVNPGHPAPTVRLGRERPFAPSPANPLQ